MSRASRDLRHALPGLSIDWADDGAGQSENPGGSIEDGEGLVAGARREVFEQTGWICEAGRA
jgi:8-oxo-dGTP pyrophosphatase MutT (NUDIX family)